MASKSQKSYRGIFKVLVAFMCSQPHFATSFTMFEVGSGGEMALNVSVSAFQH
jgi:hypothetical protein